MRSRLFTIKDESQKRPMMSAVWDHVCEAIATGSLDVTIAAASKKRAQEKKFNAMIGDIFKQVEFKDDMGRVIKADREWIDAVLVEDFGNEMKMAGTPLRKPGRSTMSLDGMRIMQIRPSRTKFSSKEASAFIEYLMAFGAQENVTWSDPETQALYRDYFERMVNG